MYQINKTQGGFNMETKRKVPILNMDGSNPWNYYSYNCIITRC